MPESLPDLLDPWKAVSNAAVFEGEVQLASLPRLAGLLDASQKSFRYAAGSPAPEGDGAEAGADSAAVARYRLEFGHDETGRAVVRCSVGARLPLRCQRCLETYELAVESTAKLAVVGGLDEANALPEIYDPLLVEDRLFRPRDLVEDELILAVPAIPRHPNEGCRSLAASQSVAQDDATIAVEQGEDTRRPNPFAALNVLKQKANKAD